MSFNFRRQVQAASMAGLIQFMGPLKVHLAAVADFCSIKETFITSCVIPVVLGEGPEARKVSERGAIWSLLWAASLHQPSGLFGGVCGHLINLVHVVVLLPVVLVVVVLVLLINPLEAYALEALDERRGKKRNHCRSGERGIH